MAKLTTGMDAVKGLLKMGRTGQIGGMPSPFLRNKACLGMCPASMHVSLASVPSTIETGVMEKA